MKAIRLDGLGGPEVLKLVDVPDPVPGPGEVVIRVQAAGVNFADTLDRRGILPGAAPLPYVPGMEVAGTIEYKGEGVDAFGGNALVCAVPPHGGGYAQFVTVPVDRVFELPEDWTAEEAAAYPINWLTAWFALNTPSRVETDEIVLVHAAGGGVGTAAVQLASRFGARVIGTAGEDWKLQRIMDLGAGAVCNYTTQDFREVALAFTHGYGVDTVLDAVGGEALTCSLGLMAPFGRLLKYGAPSTDADTVDPGHLIGKNLRLIGFNLNQYLADPQKTRPAIMEMNELSLETGIRPVVGHTFPLAQAADAHALLESRQSFGKVVLIP